MEGTTSGLWWWLTRQWLWRIAYVKWEKRHLSSLHIQKNTFRVISELREVDIENFDIDNEAEVILWPMVRVEMVLNQRVCDNRDDWDDIVYTK
jgi:hypothetical protein